jgi:cell division protein FtsB
MDFRMRVGRKTPPKRSEPPPFFRRHARTLLAAVLALLFVHDIFGAHGFMAMRRTQKEIERLRSDIDRLNAENQQLGDEVKALRSDPKLIERIAREEMGLARPGEIIIRLPPPVKNAKPKP